MHRQRNLSKMGTVRVSMGCLYEDKPQSYEVSGITGRAVAPTPQFRCLCRNIVSYMRRVQNAHLVI